MKRARVLLLVACTVLPATAQPRANFAPKAMVAAANPLAAQTGLEILKARGSAVDAAIATQLVLNLVEPESSGIGGGAFMLVYDPAAKKTTSFDGREVAPQLARPGMFLDASGNARARGEVIPGGLSVGIPGVVGMLELAHRKYGKLPWARLFEPAIRLAENGFPIGPKLARRIAGAPRNMPDIARTFFHPDGSLYRQGEIFRNPEMAKSLRAIARGGAKAFYRGPIAEQIVTAVQKAPRNPGGMTLADLSEFKARELKPVCGPYRVYVVCSMGPPSSGGVAIVQILGMLERFPAGELKPNSVSETHLFTQASRLAYADRAKFLGDASVVAVPVRGLLNRAYIASRSALIDPARDMGTAQAGNPPEKHTNYAPQISGANHGTSHMTIVDERSQVIAMTTSVESGFGAKIMAGGFLLNNTLTDFSFQPVQDGAPVANAPAPGKRPLSAMSPTIVFDRNGNFVLGIGSPGGPAIISYVAQSLVAILDGGLSPQEAIALPRHINANTGTILERSPWADQVAGQLTAMGHAPRVGGGEGSGLHVIQKVQGGYLGGADPRRDGIVVGE